MNAFDTYMERIAAGAPLAADEVRQLAATPDILPLGMLADALRRRLHDARATFLRVAPCRFDQSFADAVPPSAGEVRVLGAPDTLDVAVTAIATAKEVAGTRTVAAFSWADVDRWAAGDRHACCAGDAPRRRTRRDRGAADRHHRGSPGRDSAAARRRVRAAAPVGVACPRRRSAGSAAARRRLANELGGIQSLNPLPAALSAFRPTTGYEDVKMVAIGRLAAPGIPSIQVDWLRYGPKLAQVALTFGADDIYGVSASDEAPEGRRRAPLEEIRRNIEAAGFEPAERDGRFATSP